jgi:hypothetical protein
MSPHKPFVRKLMVLLVCLAYVGGASYSSAFNQFSGLFMQGITHKSPTFFW